MKYIKTYEKFELNENWISQALDWIKEKLSSWVSKLSGDVRQGADYGINYLKQNPEELEKIQNGLKQQDESDIMKLWNWVKSFVGNPNQIQPIVNESNQEEEEVESILMKILRISGASLALLGIFGSVVAAFAGLLLSNGLLFVVGAIASIIAFSIISISRDSDDMSSHRW
jgi:hypothetical protein